MWNKTTSNNGYINEMHGPVCSKFGIIWCLFAVVSFFIDPSYYCATSNRFQFLFVQTAHQ